MRIAAVAVTLAFFVAAPAFARAAAPGSLFITADQVDTSNAEFEKTLKKQQTHELEKKNDQWTLYFVAMGMVEWPWAIIMAVGAIAGGYGGAGVARRIGPKGVRRIVVIVGFSISLSLLIRR